MRKSPTIQSRTCESCGEMYTPTGNGQKYCPSCKVTKVGEWKKKYENKIYPDRKPKTKCTEPCCVCGGKFSSHFDGKAYCNKHYQSMIRYGQPYGHEKSTTNQYVVEGDLLKIITQNGDVILADSEDYEKLSKHSWCVSKTGYAVANINRKVTKLHRYLLDVTDPFMVIDHKNHNRLDNRKTNIRVCSQRENAKNKGAVNNKEVGIRETKHGTYSVRITNDREEIHIGSFKTLEEAKEARLKAERKYHKEFGYHDSINQ